MSRLVFSRQRSGFNLKASVELMSGGGCSLVDSCFRCPGYISMFVVLRCIVDTQVVCVNVLLCMHYDVHIYF